MKAVKVILIGLLAIVVSAAFVKQEDIAEALTKKLAVYHLENPTPLLYLHLDKCVYNTNEDIWFKAYMLTPDVDSSKTLYVRLTDKNKKIIISAQFPMTDIRANGDMLIPDTLRDGDYYLYAYTGRMINFSNENAFVQRISVKRNSSKKMFAEAAVIDTSKLRRGQNVQVHVVVKDGINLLKNVKGQYFLIADGIPTKGGKLSTNEFGETFINFVYPQLANDKSLVVKISFQSQNDLADLTLNLRHEGNALQTKFFPEGGGFINGIPTRATVQVTDAKNNPVAATVKIKTGEQVLLNTRTSKSGLGTFSLTTANNQNYTVEVEENGVTSRFPFPNVTEATGYGLKLLKQAGGIKAVLRNRGKDENALLLLRSFDDILWTSAVKIVSGDSLIVNIPAGNVPKGVLNLSVFSSNGEMLAERMFENKQAEDFKVDIKTDYQTYGVRKKVTVNLHISGASGKPVMANLSVSAIEKVRTDGTTFKTIVDSYYRRGLSSNKANPLFGLNNDEIDELLITEHWNQAQWKDVLAYKPKGSLTVLRNTDGVTGMVQSLTKKPVKLKDLMVLSKSRIFQVLINENNLFFIPARDLIRDRSEKEYLLLNTDLAGRYKIKLMDYEGRFDELVCTGNALQTPDIFNYLARYQESKLSPFKGVIMMKEVKIKSSVSSSTAENNGNIKVFKSTTCTDMVCMYNILNCKNHSGCCSPPVDGMVYSLNGTPVIYRGCLKEEEPTHFLLKCISIPKIFYLPDYDKEPSYEPELHSTIYWNPNINTDKNGDATFSFYTSDITGDFLITAQGVDMNIKPMHGTKTFTVK